MMPAKTRINELIQRMIEAIRVGSVISYDGPREYGTYHMGGEASLEVARLLSSALVASTPPAPVSSESVEVDLIALLGKALSTLDTYADPTGYTDGYGELLPADAVEHEGSLAASVAREIRAAITPSQPLPVQEAFAFHVKVAGWGEELLFTEDGAKQLLTRLRRTKGWDTEEATISPLYRHSAPSSTGVVGEDIRNALEEAYIRGATWYRQNEDFGGLLRKAAQDYADFQTAPQMEGN